MLNYSIFSFRNNNLFLILRLNKLRLLIKIHVGEIIYLLFMGLASNNNFIILISFKQFISKIIPKWCTLLLFISITLDSLISSQIILICVICTL